MNTRTGTYTLIAALLIAFSGASEAGRAGSSSSSSGSGGGTATGAAMGIAAGAVAGSAIAGKMSADEQQRLAEKQGRQVELAKIADDKRKADETSKREEIERLAKQAEEDRQQEAARLALEKKKKEQVRQQATLESRCVLKPVMSDAEIARCR